MFIFNLYPVYIHCISTFVLLGQFTAVNSVSYFKIHGCIGIPSAMFPDVKQISFLKPCGNVDDTS